MKIASFLITLTALAGSNPASGASQLDRAAAAGQLNARLIELQSTARRGLPAFELKVVESSQSLLEQSGDGVVRFPAEAVRQASSSDNLDALMLIALSIAVHHQAKAVQLSGGAEFAVEMLAALGQGVAQRRVEKSGRTNVAYEQTGRYRAGNPVNIPGSVNPVQRAMIWARAAGSCEERIVTQLKAMQTNKSSLTLARDAKIAIRELGASAWSPDDRCKVARTGIQFQQLKAAFSN